MIFEILFFVSFVLILLFAFVLLFGAPYLPTLSPQTKAALELIDLKKGDHLLELGCGDGRVMIAAAEQGIRVTGYELNPLLAIIAWLRTRKYGSQVKVVWGDFWRKNLPSAEGIFVFLIPKYMEKSNNKVVQEYSGKKIKLVSFAFVIPDKNVIAERAGVHLYLYDA
jgi:hypothetical protein